uniref:Uncharacterized protein n=1 Tax=Arundo donax TaxID=35708 RepID=A0A0A8XQC5_ARUDO
MTSLQIRLLFGWLFVCPRLYKMHQRSSSVAAALLGQLIALLHITREERLVPPLLPRRCLSRSSTSHQSSYALPPHLDSGTKVARPKLSTRQDFCSHVTL